MAWQEPLGSGVGDVLCGGSNRLTRARCLFFGLASGGYQTDSLMVMTIVVRPAASVKATRRAVATASCPRPHSRAGPQRADCDRGAVNPDQRLPGGHHMASYCRWRSLIGSARCVLWRYRRPRATDDITTSCAARHATILSSSVVAGN